ncbi:MAG: putative toxin-antitoxin system toxin component, PIN family [Deltaproteobacteria bacterium]|nr:MAG: putative toxin-antitoxin system toxin component, PIN family [Deltaproteobacteria bacterium]
MKVVIDTNVWIESISKKSRFHLIYKSFLDGKFRLLLSNEILLEYEEIIKSHCNHIDRSRFIFIMNISPYIIRISPTFRFNLITHDPADNKFVDCAITGQADFLITSDKHFKILSTENFPPVPIIAPDKFIQHLL